MRPSGKAGSKDHMEQQNTRNTVIGLVLIFAMVMAYSWLTAPSAEELKERQRVQDSIAKAAAVTPAKKEEAQQAAAATPVIQAGDSAAIQQLSGTLGAFAASAAGTPSTHVLENQLFKVTFSSKGGKISGVDLKNYQKKREADKKGTVASSTPVRLMEDERNVWSWKLNLKDGKQIGTQQLNFQVTSSSKDHITFRAQAADGTFLEQTYRIKPDSYEIDCEVAQKGVAGNHKSLSLEWINWMDQIEQNAKSEMQYVYINYYTEDDGYDYMTISKNGTEEVKGNPIKWVSNTNQFFNTTLIAKTNFVEALLQAKSEDLATATDLAQISNTIQMPLSGEESKFGFSIYAGPNEFKRLAAMDANVEDIIPYGSSILGTLNRWVVRPIFNFLLGLIGSQGIVILVLTLIVKLALFPLTYKMIYSQARMAALKPAIDKLKDKFKDDQTAVGAETMKLYQEYGVNPLGGCMPVLLQMPIWLALYRFFPASIEFRQASFLWATDLSSYDVFAWLPVDIPGYGQHVSMFTLLWTLSTLFYSWYSTRQTDFSMQPAMKYMQYIFPLMFFFVFNSLAAGLTCYMMFSNFLNIGQTFATKNFLIDQKKIEKELEVARTAPKKKSGFAARFDTMMKEQMKKAEEAKQVQQQPKNKKK